MFPKLLFEGDPIRSFLYFGNVIRIGFPIFHRI